MKINQLSFLPYQDPLHHEPVRSEARIGETWWLSKGDTWARWIGRADTEPRSRGDTGEHARAKSGEGDIGAWARWQEVVPKLPATGYARELLAVISSHASSAGVVSGARAGVDGGGDGEEGARDLRGSMERGCASFLHHGSNRRRRVYPTNKLTLFFNKNSATSAKFNKQRGNKWS
jgi:hypothetical protein